MRLLRSLAAAGLLATALAAQADTYTLTFVSASTGTQVGAGALSFAGPSPLDDYSGQYTTLPLTDFAATINSQAFNFDDAGRMGQVVFHYGTISDYHVQLYNGYAGVETLSFNYIFNPPDLVDGGVITSQFANSASSITPEPSSFALLGTGLLGLACVLKRRLA